MDEEVMGNHPDEPTSRQKRVHRLKGAIGDPPLDVATQKLVQAAHLRFKEEMRKVVAFQGTEQQQTQERGILLRPGQALEANSAKHPGIVLPGGGMRRLRQGLL